MEGVTVAGSSSRSISAVIAANLAKLVFVQTLLIRVAVIRSQLRSCLLKIYGVMDFGNSSSHVNNWLESPEQQNFCAGQSHAPPQADVATNSSPRLPTDFNERTQSCPEHFRLLQARSSNCSTMSQLPCKYWPCLLDYKRHRLYALLFILSNLQTALLTGICL